MHSGPTFPHPRKGAITDGATQEGSWTGFWTSPRWRVGRLPVKRGSHVSLRRRTKPHGEASEPMLPRKTPREPDGARTANRHRWVGREYQGDRENYGQGTRQNRPVTSGEGAPAWVEALAARARSGRSEKVQATVYQKHRTLLKS